jgi:hypothetical protein
VFDKHNTPTLDRVTAACTEMRVCVVWLFNFKSNLVGSTVLYTAYPRKYSHIFNAYKKAKAVPMKALGGRGSIAPTHSRPRH